MQTCLAVGAGGALGAICRYLFSLIPFPGPFPVATLFRYRLGGTSTEHPLRTYFVFKNRCLRRFYNLLHLFAGNCDAV